MVWRSPADQPRWARPTLLVLAAVAGVAYGWRMGSSIEIYYAAAARSMSASWHDFAYGAFDPAGTISIDKLPGAVVPSAVRPALRVPHLGHRSAPGGGGRAHHPRPLPSRPSAGRCAGRHRGRRRAGRFPGGGHPRQGQHLGHTVDPLAGPRSRCPGGVVADGQPPRGAPRRIVGRAGLPGKDGRGVAGHPRPGDHLPCRLWRNAADPPAATGRHGGCHRHRLVELDELRVAHPCIPPPLRGREPARLDLRAGVRLQRLGAGGPAFSER